MKDLKAKTNGELVAIALDGHQMMVRRRAAQAELSARYAKLPKPNYIDLTAHMVKVLEVRDSRLRKSNG